MQQVWQAERRRLVAAFVGKPRRDTLIAGRLRNHGGRRRWQELPRPRARAVNLFRLPPYLGV